MEFLPIGETKLKIVLYPEDLREYRLDLSGVEYKGDASRRGLWQILDKARDEVGFDPRGDKILIQFYPTKDEKCEVFVTKLGVLPESSAKLVAKSERVTMISRKRNFYCFESLEDLSSACREIKRGCRETTLPECDVYFDGAEFYLAIDEYSSGGESCEFPCITEFGTPITAERGAFLNEHGKILIKMDAVRVLSEL